MLNFPTIKPQFSGAGVVITTFGAGNQYPGQPTGQPYTGHMGRSALPRDISPIDTDITLNQESFKNGSTAPRLNETGAKNRGKVLMPIK